MKRRTALKLLGTLAGAAAAPRLLTGCSSGPDPRVQQGLTTIVTLCMENRSYDEYLGARSLMEGKPGDGLRAGMANLDHAGAQVGVYHSKTPCVIDPPHGWEACHAQWNGGKNDGFVTAYQQASGDTVSPEVMGYLTRAEVPVTWALADAGTSCDRWFSSILGPTWPNRMYLHSAQSGGLKQNVLPGSGGIEWPSIYHRLNDAGVPWAYYYGSVPFVSLWKKLDTKGKVWNLDTNFFDDAAAGTLPPVVFLDPAFNINDDHPPLHPLLGQQLIASIYNALAASPQWPNIMFVVTYDEHGGFFDHVPPPAAKDDREADGFGQLGFRVPALVLGPYARQGQTSSVVYDHTSVLAHIEKMFHLKPLTARDAAANDLGDTIDRGRLDRREPAPPVKLPEVVVDAAEITRACQHGAASRSELDELADSGFFPPGLDRRAEARQVLLRIGAELERQGGGGIRR